MKKKAIDILAKIKLALTAVPQSMEGMPTPEATNSIVLSTVDGVQVSVDKLEVGGIATINGMPAAANTYAFTDGSSITTDASGVITSVIPAAAPAAQATDPAPAANPAPQSQPVATNPAPVSQQMSKFVFTDEHKTSDGMDKLFAQFATGTPEERIANLETVAKALMEYSFGWEIRQAKEKSERDAAIKIYTEQLAPLQAQMSAQKKTIEDQQKVMSDLAELVSEFVEEPVSNPPISSRVPFSGIAKQKKGLEKYKAIAKQVADEKKSATV